MDQLKKLAGQTGIYGMSSIVGRLLNYLLVPLYTNIFAPSEYGVVTELYSLVAICLVIYLYGFETAFFRYSKDDGDKDKVYNTAFTSVLLSSLALSGLLLLFTQSIASLLVYGDHPEYIQAFALIIALDAITAIPFARLRMQGKALRFGSLKLINIGVNIGLNLFFLVLCPYLQENGTDWVNSIYDPSIGVGYIFISNLAASALTLLLVFPEIGQARLRLDNDIWRKMFAYAWPILVIGLAGMINENFGRSAMKHLIDPEDEPLRQVGIYGAAYKLSIIMVLFVQAFRYAAEPFFFAQHGKENDKKVFAEVMKYFSLIMSVIFIGVLLYLDIVKYFIGPNYHTGLHVVPLLLLAQLFLGIFYNLSVWYKLTDKTILGGYIALGGLVITLTGNLILVPKLGYVGSAWSTLACYTLMMLVSWMVGRRYFKVDYDIKRVAGPIVLAIIIYTISEWLAFVLEPSTGYKLLVNSGLFMVFLLISLGIVREKRPPEDKELP